jgi:hypothetical protein
MVFRTFKNAQKQPNPPNGLPRRVARAMTTGETSGHKISLSWRKTIPLLWMGGRRRRTGWLMRNTKRLHFERRPPTTPPFGHPSRGGEFVVQPSHQSLSIPSKSSLRGVKRRAKPLPSPACGRGVGGEGVQNSPPLEGGTPQADGVVGGKHETPALRAKTPNHPALRAPLQRRGIVNHPPEERNTTCPSGTLSGEEN